MNTALEYSTRVVQEGGRRCKKSTLNDLVHLTPLRIPLMNPPSVYYTVLYCTVLYCTVLYDRVNWLYGVKKISKKWLWPVKVTLKVIKRRLLVFCWSCDEIHLKWEEKKFPSLQFINRMSLLLTPPPNGRSMPLRPFSRQCLSTNGGQSYFVC